MTTTIPGSVPTTDVLLVSTVFSDQRSGATLRGLTTKGDAALAEVAYRLDDRYYFLPEDCGGEPLFIPDGKIDCALRILRNRRCRFGTHQLERGLKLAAH